MGQLTILTGPRAERALWLLQELAHNKEDVDLTKKDCISCLRQNDLPEFADEIKDMEAQEFEDFLVNHVY